MGIIIRNTNQGGRITFRGLGLGGRITSGWPVASTSALLLDTYPGAAAAYSLRKLSSTYNGSAIRVRRSSDSVEQNIGFVNNTLDISSLSTFIGSNSGFVTTWYDQSGNVSDAIQSTAGNQPRIVNAGTIDVLDGLPLIQFIRANSTFLVNSTISTTASTTRFIASVQNVSTYNNFGAFWSNNSLNNYQLSSQNSAPPSIYYFNGLVTTPYTIYNGKDNFLNILSNTTSFLNSEHRITFSDSKGFTGLRLGNTPGGTTTDALQGTISEFVFYNADQSSILNEIRNNISIYYMIKPANPWIGTGNALLDTYPASAAYSIRNLSSTYTGALIRVRRSSDNAEKNIYGITNGSLDTTSLLSFVNTGSGFVSVWYDQSGGFNHLYQNTITTQPQIVSSGSYLGYLLYDGVDDTLTATNGNISWTGSFALVTTVTSPDASTPNGVNDSAPVVQIPEAASWGTIYQTVGPTFLKWRFGTGQTSNDNSYTRTNSTAFCLVNTIKNSTSESVYLNNSLALTVTSKLSTMANNSSTTINTAKGAVAGFWKGYQKEIIIHNSNQSSSLSSINANINSYYTIY
jgi:hypothetical protein